MIFPCDSITEAFLLILCNVTVSFKVSNGTGISDIVTTRCYEKLLSLQKIKFKVYVVDENYSLEGVLS